MKSIKLILILFVVLLLSISCRKDRIETISASSISGKLSYQNGAETLAAPAGTTVSVYQQDNPNPISTFKTTQKGSYTFSPQAQGNYFLKFSFTDTLLQYNAAIRQKVDLDSLRQTSRTVNLYENTATDSPIGFAQSNRHYERDYVLTTASTRLRILATDEQNNPLREVRICLYTNQTFANQNAPYCGGSVAYLATDANGIATFSGLEAKKYYLNARAEVGQVKLNNQWSLEMKETQPLTAGALSSKTIILK